MQVALSKTAETSVVVVGAGGNIGSHLVPHLARMSGIGPRLTNVTLIDKDTYEARNLASQSITPRDVGRGKAGVQARILRGVSSSLTVTALNHAVEELPLGRMRADVIIACLDSRRSRQYVNQVAWRLGVPWIDAGVQADGLLARVNVYLPGPDNPCLECAWGQDDYEALEQVYPCANGEREVFATNAPSSLGALAASLQAIECQKLLLGQFNDAVVSKEFVIDARHHKTYLTSFRRNPSCRFPDHRPWKIQRLDLAVNKSTLADLISLTKCKTARVRGHRLSVEGKRFIGARTCRGCGCEKGTTAFARPTNGMGPKCPRCGGMMFAAGKGIADSVDLTTLSPALKRRSLRSMGLGCGDVFSIQRNDVQLHFEISSCNTDPSTAVERRSRR